jgi:magnesium-transporting ATPase (P-type)
VTAPGGPWSDPATAPRSPWSDPATETEPVAWAGPPVYPAPPGSPAPGYGWAPSPYWPAYGPPVPARPRRPGQLVAAAVLAFVQAAVVTLTSAYLLLLASTFGVLASGSAGDPEAESLVTEAVVVTVVQLLSAIALVVGGVVVLHRRSRPSWLTLLVAFAVQLALALYWVLRLATLDGSTDDVLRPAAVLVVGVLFFAAAPAVGLGLLLTGTVRRWATGEEPAGGAAGSR